MLQGSGEFSAFPGATMGLESLSPADEAANLAARAFGHWSKTDPKERIEILDAMAQQLDADIEEISQIAAIEMGASAHWTRFNLQIAKDILQSAGALTSQLEDQVSYNSERGTRSIIRRQPVGVVLGFAPWNAPLTLAVRAAAAPIACGNTVVLKVSEHCVKTHEAVIASFHKAGLPEGVAVSVKSDGQDPLDVARQLIAHPAIRRVNFTGSTRVGRFVAEIAAAHLKPCLLELSGKAPMIILDDADLDLAVSAAALGAFFNQGQICMSTERIIVQHQIADAFCEKLVDKTKHLHAADPAKMPAPMGRLVDAEAARRISGLIEDAVAKGAHLLIGGQVEDAVMQPAIVDGVSADMRLYTEESFGPVASILRVYDDEEAISIANDTEYGLASAVFSQDLDRAMAVADVLETGICQINGPSVYDEADMPFGGVKNSGYGRFGGPTVIDEFTEMRWIAHHVSGSPAHYDAFFQKGGSQ